MKSAGVIGPGRAGTGIALGLARAGLRVFMHGRSQRPLPAEISPTWGGPVPPWLDVVDSVLLAVPDDAITAVAAALAESSQVRSRHVVLHLSGVLDRSALAPLQVTGAALGSFHPLQTFTDPQSAPARLQGAIASLEGDERAVEAGERLARLLGMHPIRLAGTARARYHAGAVFASNYVVVLAAVARRVLHDAGVPAGVAWQGLQQLLAGTAANLSAGSPEQALTGPIARGDANTVRRHLDVLDPEQATLYRELGNLAVELADLSPERRREITRALSTAEPGVRE